MKLTLLLLCLLLPLPMLAQELPYEQQKVVLADGTEARLWISLDERSDLLHYKHDQNGETSHFTASDVVSFSFATHHYYSLPLREGYFTFFRVHHEGEAFAVLEKAPNFKVLRAIVDDSGGRISMCQNRRKYDFYLCYVDNRQYGASPLPINTSNTVREFEVRKLVYLAVAGKLKLFYMETNDRHSFWDDIIDIRPGKRSADRMLEHLIDDPRKRAAILRKIKQDKLDVRNPQQLIVALEAAYK